MEKLLEKKNFPNLLESLDNLLESLGSDLQQFHLNPTV